MLLESIVLCSNKKEKTIQLLLLRLRVDAYRTDERRDWVAHGLILDSENCLIAFRRADCSCSARTAVPILTIACLSNYYLHDGISVVRRL